MSDVGKKIVIEAFQYSFANAKRDGMTDLDPPMIAEHPFVTETLVAIKGLSLADDLSATLSKRADELQKWAADNRSAPEWADVCIAMGAIRNAAVTVWQA
jgi:hypothetical protein